MIHLKSRKNDYYDGGKYNNLIIFVNSLVVVTDEKYIKSVKRLGHSGIIITVS